MGQGYSTDPSFWGNKGQPIPNGISQGQLGDCWFLAAVSSLAEEPDRITRVVWNQDYNKKGAFRFFFWIKDGWYGINIDDRLPVITWGNGYRTWATGRSMNEAWWMPLLEKAFAKLDQNYDSIIGGNGMEGLRTLTGMPVTDIPNKKDDITRLYPIHKYWASRNFPMTTGCCYNGGTDGLISGHAYSLLDIKELTNDNGEVVHTIVQVRNPWSNEHYTGKWRDDDPDWTDAWKEQAGLVVKNDGKFWMPYDTFISYFMNVAVAMYQPYEYK